MAPKPWGENPYLMLISRNPEGKLSSRDPNGDGVDEGGSVPGVPSFTLSSNSTSITATITNANGATSYDIRVSQVDPPTGSGTAGLTASGLSASTTYYVQVRGTNQYGTGNWSASQSKATAAAGSPSISSVSGTFTAGQTITVNGSGFGTKPTAAPAIPVEDFSGGSEGQRLDNYDPGWISYNEDGALLTTSDSVEGGVSAYNDTTRYGFKTNYKHFPQTDKAFISSHYKISPIELGVTDGQIKFQRLSSSGSAGGGGVYSGAGSMRLAAAQPSGNASPGMFYENGDIYLVEPLNQPAGYSNDYLNMSYNVWVRVDYEAILSDAGVANGFLHYEIMNNERQEFVDVTTRAAGASFQFDTFLLGLMHANNAGNPDFTIYTDLVYADTTFARVEIGDNPDYYACTYRRLLNPSAWSDSQVQATVPHTVPAGSYYVFVTTDDRERASYGVTV